MKAFSIVTKSVAAFAAIIGLASGAFAADVPKSMQFQGFLTDDAGTPINGDTTVKIGLYQSEEGGPAVWTDTQTLAVADGQFTMLLGSEANPLDDNVFSGQALWIGVAVGSEDEMTPRHPVVSVPYAIRAQKAEWAAAADTASAVGWGGVTGIPAGFADGEDNVLTEAQVLAMVAGADYVNSSALEAYFTAAEIETLLAAYALSSHSHRLSDITDVPASCAQDQILKWNGVAWACGEDVDTDTDTDTTYSGLDFALSSQLCADGSMIAGIDGNGLILCAEDKDTDTTYSGIDFAVSNQTCPEGKVATGISPFGVIVCAADKDTDTDTLTGLACSNGQVAKWNVSSWACADDIDTDTNTTYSGVNFAKSNQSCDSGYVMTGVDASGNIVCTVAAGGSGSSFADTVYGDGVNGTLTISAPTTWSETDLSYAMGQYTNITINSSLTVPSGTLLRCNGTFTVGAGGSINVASGYASVTSAMYARPALALTAPSANATYLVHKLPAIEAAQITRAPSLSGSNGNEGTGLAIGGKGGGGLTIRAKGAVTINGSINANGGAGDPGIEGMGSGGGSGGFVIITSQTSITNNGTINVRGGNGGASTAGTGVTRPGSGGGGGGIIHLMSPSMTAGVVNLTGGSAGAKWVGTTTTIDGRSGGALGGDGGLAGLDGGDGTAGGTGLLILSQNADPTSLLIH